MWKMIVSVHSTLSYWGRERHVGEGEGGWEGERGREWERDRERGAPKKMDEHMKRDSGRWATRVEGRGKGREGVVEEKEKPREIAIPHTLTRTHKHTHT